MKKQDFTQSVTHFKPKSKTVQPVIIQPELVESLIGNETDKAPSVKAVNDALEDKVSKFATKPSSYAVYGMDTAGNDLQVLLDSKNVNQRVPMYSTNSGHGQYDRGGFINTTIPVYPYHCANKAYVDEMKLFVELDPSTYVLTIKLIGGDGTTLNEYKLDLPLESMIIGAEVSEDGSGLILTLNNDEKTQITFSVADMLDGLASEDYVDEGLAGKVTSTGKKNTVYGVGADGKDDYYHASSTNVAGYVVTYGSNGQGGTLDRGGHLTTSDPINLYHAANKKYVDEELVKKLDAKSVTSGMYVYTTEGSGQGTRQLVTNPSAWNVPIYGTNGVLKANTPENEKDVTNKNYVDTGLAGKVPLPAGGYQQYKLYMSSKNQDGTIATSFVATSPVGTTNSTVAYWYKSDSGTFDNVEPTCTLGVADPIKPIQAANKRYVDTELLKKLDKITDTSMAGIGGGAYILKQDGTQGMIKITNTIAAGTVPWRGSGGVVVVGKPTAGTHAANMQYVNDEDTKLSNRITDLEGKIGGLIKTETIQASEQDITVPPGALPNIYIDYAKVNVTEYDGMTNQIVNSFEIKPTTITFRGEAYEELETTDYSDEGYYRMPESTWYISFNWDEVLSDYYLLPCTFYYEILATFQTIGLGG